MHRDFIGGFDDSMDMDDMNDVLAARVYAVLVHVLECVIALLDV